MGVMRSATPRSTHSRGPAARASRSRSSSRALPRCRAAPAGHSAEGNPALPCPAQPCPARPRTPRRPTSALGSPRSVPLPLPLLRPPPPPRRQHALPAPPLPQDVPLRSGTVRLGDVAGTAAAPARPGPPRTHRARRLAGSRRPEPQQRERPARRLHLRSHLRRRGSGCRATVLHRRRGAGRGGAGSARPPGSAPSCAPRRRRRTAMSGSRLLRGLPVSRGTDGPADRQTERPRRGAVSSLCPAAVPCVCVYVCSSGPPPAGCAAKPRLCSVRRTSPPAPRRRPAVLWFGCVAFLLSAFTLGRFCPAAVPLRARTLTSLRSLLSPLLIDAVAGHGRFWNGPGLAPNCTRSCAASRARSHQPPPRVCTDCRRQLV